MQPPIEYITYTDAQGKQYTETATSPIAVTLREDELREQGYIVDK